MAQLAIKGHPTRGKEVIEILEMLGGRIRRDRLAGNELFSWYYINGNGYIDYKHYSLFDDTTVLILEEFLEKFPYKVGDKVSSKYLKNYKIEKMEWEDNNNRVIYKLQGMGWYAVNELQPYKEETMEETIKIDIPKGYEFAGVDDDNQQVVFEKIGCQYPKTYEECLKILGYNIAHTIPMNHGHNGLLLMKFQRLLIYRDAYWKIAGEQMRLDKSWEPDFTDFKEERYGLYTKHQTIVNVYGCGDENIIFVFPTAEMCDAFYENFKDLIEQCKELL